MQCRAAAARPIPDARRVVEPRRADRCASQGGRCRPATCLRANRTAQSLKFGPPQARTTSLVAVSEKQQVLWLRYHSIAVFAICKHFSLRVAQDSERQGAIAVSCGAHESANTHRAHSTDHLLELFASRLVDHLHDEENGSERAGCIEPVSDGQSSGFREQREARTDQKV